MTGPQSPLIDALAALDDTPERVFRHPGAGEQATHQRVTLDDGTEFLVKVGNRDLVAWDRGGASKKYPREAHPFVFANFLAYNAARRGEQFAGTFDGPGGWLDRCEDLTPLIEVDGEEPGPTRPAAPSAIS